MLGTSSSESALPRMMAKMEGLGCAQVVVGLVVPGGLLLQPRRHLHLPHPGGLFLAQATNTEVDPVAASRAAGDVAADLQGCRRRHRRRVHHPGGDAVGRGQHPGGLGWR